MGGPGGRGRTPRATDLSSPLMRPSVQPTSVGIGVGDGIGAPVGAEIGAPDPLERRRRYEKRSEAGLPANVTGEQIVTINDMNKTCQRWYCETNVFHDLTSYASTPARICSLYVDRFFQTN